MTDYPPPTDQPPTPPPSEQPPAGAVPPPSTPLAAPQPPLSDAEARSWAMLAHLSVLLNLVTGFLGVVAPLVIYLIYKERSRYVAYQSMQSFVFQLVWWVGGGLVVAAFWTITGITSAFLIGLLCIPIALLLSLIPVVPLVWGVYGGIQCNQGKDFKYWLVGDWVRSLA